MKKQKNRRWARPVLTVLIRQQEVDNGILFTCKTGTGDLTIRGPYDAFKFCGQEWASDPLNCHDCTSFLPS